MEGISEYGDKLRTSLQQRISWAGVLALQETAYVMVFICQPASSLLTA
jgi:hypothetical protein